MLTCQSIGCEQELHVAFPWWGPYWTKHSPPTCAHSNKSAVVNNSIFSQSQSALIQTSLTSTDLLQQKVDLYAETKPGLSMST